MKNFIIDIEAKTLENNYFREVLFTAQHCQLVIMSLLPKEEIGLETHEVTDQFIRVEAGEGIALLDGKEHALKDGIVLVITAGTEHNIINTSATEKLKLYSIYSPAHHRDKTIHKTRAEAEADEHDHIG